MIDGKYCSVVSNPYQVPCAAHGRVSTALFRTGSLVFRFANRDWHLWSRIAFA